MTNKDTSARPTSASMSEFIMDETVAEILEQALDHINQLMPEAVMDPPTPRVSSMETTPSNGFEDGQADGMLVESTKWNAVAEDEKSLKLLEFMPTTQQEEPRVPAATNFYASLVPKKRKQASHEDGQLGASNDSQARPFAPPLRAARKPKPSGESMDAIVGRNSGETGKKFTPRSASGRYSRGDLETLKSVRTLIEKCKIKAEDGQEAAESLANLRQSIHRMEMYPWVTEVLVAQSRLLDSHGLPAIFNDQSGIFPWDIQADSRALHERWTSRHFESDMSVGTLDFKQTSNGKEIKGRMLDSKDTARISCNHFGHGQLPNGAWFALRIYALRNGCHGEMEAGIHGQWGKGAYSVVMSGGGYADEDGGDVIKYCGTPGKNGQDSAGTRLLKLSMEKQTALRVVRSSGLPATNPFRPAKGLRYDGLYLVESAELLDHHTAMHRFLLRRQAGQDPIRYQGVEKRPTDHQLAHFAEVRKHLGLK